ncbi:hypothetical protein [Rhizobium sp. Rhizsp82]|uniref:hypothetical protein n=1 Tax=Rhizobium sp. Rhizsp82 TaxID=3243057 RepID=UPI0039B54E3F
MAEFNARDKSRTASTKADQMRSKNTQPPKDQGGWIAVTMQFLESAAYRSLSLNARRALDRLKIEHISHGRKRNGLLIVTHLDFIAYGLTKDLVGDAIDELVHKGLVRVTRGRAGNGTAHPNVFALTFDGTHDGLSATNDWAKITSDDIRRWSVSTRQLKLDARSKVGRKKKPRSEKSESVHPHLSESVGLSEVRR